MIKQAIGITLIVTSLFMLLGFVSGDREHGILVEILAFLLAVFVPFAGGTYLLYSRYKAKKNLEASKDALRMKTLEAEILKLAKSKGGKLTVVEVMTDLALGSDAAKELLDTMAGKSLAEIELTESGIIVYAFYEVQHLKDKESARGVLDA